ncbi:MAG: class I SAM-dependent rRNA methyltransferase [Ignavibacteria bacterium]|nr:class I SAM-dependent rRNA methyltransferase [Ignavibacteria bacterium]
MKIITMRPREEKRIKEGHLWVNKDDLSHDLDVPPGTLVRVSTFDGASMGTGFYNPLSKIAVRLLACEEEEAGTAFFVKRIGQAQALRQLVLPNEEGYRVVYGEADLLSGLIIDRYGDYLVMQMLSAGMDVRKQNIIEALLTVFPTCKGIVEKNMSQTRTREGLELVDGVVWGTVPERIQFMENGLRLEIDLTTGQKTGYFLDQKVNRAMVAKLAKGRTVLDCFCNVGGFALNAAAAGASLAVGIDSSALAVEAATRNAELNGLTNCSFEKANVFDLLRDHLAEERAWDMIVLDPPSFAKHRGALRGALAGYAELNRTALKLLKPGGILVTSSCTQPVTEHDLMDILYRESARVRRRLRLIYRGAQAPDHPVLLAMPETQYLKFLVFEVADA